MQFLRYLQHWLTGRGPCLQVANFVPETHPIRQWAGHVSDGRSWSPPWTARLPSASLDRPHVDVRPSRRECYWRWSS